MPSSTLGWTRLEIVNKILDSIGRSNDSTARSRLSEDINFAQLSFWKEFNWKFGWKNGITDSLRFALIASTSEYTLNTATIGKEMRASNIAKIYATDTNYIRDLIKCDLQEIRHADPGLQNTGFPVKYAISSDNRVVVWPVPTSTEAGKYLYIDGKVQPTFLSLDGDYPDTPIEYQETFMQYLLVRALSRERDPRQTEELAIYREMLKRDKSFDLQQLESNLRIKEADEVVGNGLARPTVQYAKWFGGW